MKNRKPSPTKPAKSQADHHADAAKGKEAPDEAKFLRSWMGRENEGKASSMGGNETDDDKPAVLLKAEDPGKRMRSFRTRTISTVGILLVFIAVIWAGHLPLLFLVLTLQTLMIREAFSLGMMADEDKRLPGFRAQQWYFFFVSTFYLYLRFISGNLLVEVTSNQTLAKLFGWAVKRHQLISYFLYCAGLIMFVLSLKRGMYLYQFAQYTWTHMIILMVIMPTSFFVSNTFQGIIWYILPAMLIVVNDIFAYLAGFFFGRTPLIRISPKKTWEGFIGAFICTSLFAFYAAQIMSKFSWLTCPRRDLSLGRLSCQPDRIFISRSFSMQELAVELPGPLEEIMALLHIVLPAASWEALMSWRITVMPVQLHAMIMSFFASLISPFGGFFASGFKRAFKLKDFGDTIPGHGGITDRFDCQVLMAMFSYLYYWNYVHVSAPSVTDTLETAVRLSNQQQLELFLRLGNLLVGEGLLPDGTMASVSPLVNLNAEA